MMPTGKYLRTFWHRNGPVITGFLGTYPNAAGILCGCCVALSILAGVCVFTFQMAVQRKTEGHTKVIAQMKAAQIEVGDLLTLLNASYAASCSPDDLSKLRSLVFHKRYTRDIAVLNARRQLVCNANYGLLSDPIATRAGDIQSTIGRYIFRAPVPLAEGVIEALVVERGQFQVVMDQRLVQDAFSLYADNVWAGQGEQRRHVYKGKAGQLLDPDPTPSPAPLRIDWTRLLVTVTSYEPGLSPITIQSILHWSDLYQSGTGWLVSILALCLLAGLLSGKLVARHAQFYRSLDYRIRHLCMESNIVCHYQPIVELLTGRIVGCEVLTRLRDGGTLMYPDQFIPLLVKNQLTWIFDAAASHCALNELATSLPPGQGFSVALNFFPQNIRGDALHAHLQNARKGGDERNFRIDIEITEYDFRPEIMPELHALKQKGYAISLDDFGTGYSNLGMLKRVAPDYIKIDRSFVAEMGDTTLRASLVPEILAIAKAVGSEVIAEGIESAGQALQLAELGVQLGQGFHFSKPLPLDAFLQFLMEHQKR